MQIVAWALTSNYFWPTPTDQRAIGIVAQSRAEKRADRGALDDALRVSEILTIVSNGLRR
jgi:hypothetical protein